MSFKYKLALTAGFAAIIAGAAFQLAIPLLLGSSVDVAISITNTVEEQNRSVALRQMLQAGGLIIGAALLRGVFAFVHTYIGENIGQRITRTLRLQYYEKLQRLSFSYYDRVHTGDLITRGIVDTEGVRRFISVGLLRSALLIIVVLVGTVLMVRIDVPTGLMALSFAPIVIWRAIITRLKLRKGWLEVQEKLSDLTKVMDENLAGIRVVKAFAAQDYEIEKYDRSSNAIALRLRKLIDVRSFNVSLMNFIFFSSIGAALLVGGLRVMSGIITVGELTSIITFMVLIQLPVQSAGLMVNAYARASSSGGRLFEILDMEPAIRDSSTASPIKIKKGKLEFRNVSFSYGDQPALYDVSFTAEHNHTIGIVGPPGSGKSTIAHLIPRFYDVTQGEILIDGQNIKDVTLESLRQSVEVVEQNAFLFNTTLENNVAYGNPWASLERVAEVARSSQLHDYIERLPLGYHSLIGEQGVSLSGGQRQRLSIARSILLQPSIIVFDDSTAAIDAVTEQRIRTALKDATKDKTVIIISHRLSSLMHADEILLIEDGRIKERGTHESLLELGGAYKEIYELQIRPSDNLLLETVQ